MIRGPITAFWPIRPLPGNMGDILTPVLVSRLNGVPPRRALHCGPGTHLVVGSVLRFAVPGSHVWGTGAMRVGDHAEPAAIYHAVRGPLSREAVLRCGGECPEIYGDPALLLPRIHQTEVAQRYGVGIVPHYVDYKAAHKRWGGASGIRTIDILRSDPLKVVDEIRSCSSVVSSSLHGLIVANAYGIPGVLVAPLEGTLNGDGTKFRDYFASIHSEPYEPIVLTGTESAEQLEALVRSVNGGPFRIDDRIDLDALLGACPFYVPPGMGQGGGVPTVVSVFTQGYAHHATRLKADCERVGIPYRIEPRNPIGQWIDNTRLKASLVWDVLRETNRPVLWIDADGSLLQWPSALVGQKFDFAAHAKTPKNHRCWSVGTLYFGATENGRRLAERWAHWCENIGSGNSDEAALDLAWKELEKDVAAFPLPDEYFALRKMEGTVILHRLSGNASRCARNRG